MADVKITALAVLTAADPINDAIPIVDVSDITMAASGTTKRISVNNILGASGTATLASATITGALGAAGLNVTGATIPANGVYLASGNNLSFAFNSTLGMSLNAGGLLVNNTSGFNTVANIKLKVGGRFLSGISGIGAYSFGTADAGGFVINDAGDGTTENRLLTLNSTGLGVGVTPSAGNGAIQLSAGVGFPATQVASANANTLDDYEEGTFTPTVLGSTFAGTATYTQNAGYYTKVGNLVTASVFLGWSAHTGTGNMFFGGLPFTSSSGFNSYSAASVSYINNIALTASNVLNLLIGAGLSYLEAYQYPVGGGAANTVPIDVAGSIIFTVTYRV